MRWFKHMSGSGQDEKLMRLKDEFGMAGYGVYWSILEIIASQMNPDNQQTSVTFSLKNWRKVTDFSPQKLQVFVTFASNLKLFSSEMNGKELTINCPNLLKFKDEYSKKAERKPADNSGQVSGHTPSSEKEQSTEKEQIKETSTKKYSSDDLDVAIQIFQAIQKMNPEHKEPDFNSWADNVRLIRERDGKSHNEIFSLFVWANGHHFWKSNILSPKKLRKHWDKLMIQRQQKPTSKRRTFDDHQAHLHDLATESEKPKGIE